MNYCLVNKYSAGPMSALTNKVRNKETNEQMQSRKIRFGQDLNQGRLDERPVP